MLCAMKRQVNESEKQSPSDTIATFRFDKIRELPLRKSEVCDRFVQSHKGLGSNIGRYRQAETK
jgi:hypothetical protein